MRAKASGSCSRIHSSLGAVNPGSMRLPVQARRCASPRRSSTALHWDSQRPSFQSWAGRMQSPWASRATSPCICPARPTASIAPGSMRAASRAAATAWRVLRHQSSGSCSLHPDRGTTGRWSPCPTPHTIPSESTTSTLVALVPRSMPRTAIATPAPGTPAPGTAAAGGQCHRHQHRPGHRRQRRSAPPPSPQHGPADGVDLPPAPGTPIDAAGRR